MRSLHSPFYRSQTIWQYNKTKVEPTHLTTPHIVYEIKHLSERYFSTMYLNPPRMNKSAPVFPQVAPPQAQSQCNAKAHRGLLNWTRRTVAATYSHLHNGLRSVLGSGLAADARKESILFTTLNKVGECCSPSFDRRIRCKSYTGTRAAFVSPTWRMSASAH